MSEMAAAEIKAFNRDASIIIMLRDPTELLQSMYYMFRYDGNEHLPSFEEALAAEEQRRAGKLLTRQTYFAQGLVYRNIVRFTEQVKRYFDTFGRENVHVIIYDDFAADTAAAYRETLEFLGVDSTQRAPEFKVINGNRYVKSSAFQTVLNDGLVRRAALAIRPMVPKGLFVALRKMRENWMRSNLHFEKRPALSTELQVRLKSEFALEIERLSELLGRDLTHWSKW
jgi:Sulfotransferase domain